MSASLTSSNSTALPSTDLPHCVVKHRTDLQSLTSWCSAFSLVLALMCLSVRLMDRSTRGFPARTATMTAFVSAVFSLNIFMGYTMDYRQMDPQIHDEGGSKADAYDHYCTAQAVIFQYTAATLVGFVLFISLLTYQIVVMRIQAWQIAHQERRFLISITAWATLITFFPVLVHGWGVYGQSSGIMACWFDDILNQLYYFYWFMCFVVLAIIFMAVRITKRLFMLMKSEWIMHRIVETNSGSPAAATAISTTTATTTHTSAIAAIATSHVQRPSSVQRGAPLLGPTHCPGLRVGGSDSAESRLEFDGGACSVSTAGGRGSAVSVATGQAAPSAAATATATAAAAASPIERIQGSAALANYSFFTEQLTRAMLYQMLRHLLFVLLFTFTFITVILDFGNRLCEQYKGYELWRHCKDGWHLPCDTTYVSTISTSMVGVFVAVAFLRFPQDGVCRESRLRGTRFLTRTSDSSSEASVLHRTTTARSGWVSSNVSDSGAYSKLSDGTMGDTTDEALYSKSSDGGV